LSKIGFHALHVDAHQIVAQDQTAAREVDVFQMKAEKKRKKKRKRKIRKRRNQNSNNDFLDWKNLEIY